MAAVEERRPMAAMVAKRRLLVVVVFMVVKVPLFGVLGAGMVVVKSTFDAGEIAVRTPWEP
jgi:hypothetical protein